MKNLFKFISIAGVDSISIYNALKSDMTDFEDAVQAETAKHNDINIVITRNKNDFKNSGLMVYSPDEYITLVKSKKLKVKSYEANRQFYYIIEPLNHYTITPLHH